MNAASLIALLVVGLILFSAGLFMVYPPLALIVLGGSFISVALVAQVRDR